MINLFDIIQDKSNELYFTDNEKVSFLNMAQRIFISEHIENNYQTTPPLNHMGVMSGRSIESTQGSTDVLSPLIVGAMRYTNSTLSPIQTDNSGRLTSSVIEAAINYTSGKATKVSRMLSIGRISNGVTYPVKFVRHNDHLTFSRNSFLSPTEDEPYYIIDGDDYIIYPNSSNELEVSVLREPVEMVYVNDGSASNVDCELSNSVHDRILDRALSLAGISGRDVALLQLKDTINNQDIN
jgi:hypothetical protein